MRGEAFFEIRALVVSFMAGSPLALVSLTRTTLTHQNQPSHPICPAWLALAIA